MNKVGEVEGTRFEREWRSATGQILATIRDPLMLRHAAIAAAPCGVVHELNLHGAVSQGEAVVGLLESPRM